MPAENFKALMSALRAAGTPDLQAACSDRGVTGPCFGVPVAVPRDFTERPESLEFGNSILIGENRPVSQMIDASVRFFEDYSLSTEQLAWLGDGKTSRTIVDIMKKELN